MIYLLLNLSVVSSIVGILVIGLRYSVFKRCAPKWGYYAWLFPVVLGFLPLNRLIQKVKEMLFNAYIHFAMGTGWEFVPHQLVYKKQFEQLVSRSIFAIHLPQALLSIWGVGFSLFLSYHMIANKRYKAKIINHRNKVVGQPLEIFMRLKEQLKLSRKIRLLNSPLVISPITVGLFKTYIILPEHLKDEDELFCILQHELIHIKRNDLLYKAMFLILHAVHWYNPLFYIMAPLLSQDCELACDERVLVDSSDEEKMFYGEALLNTIQGSVEKGQSISPRFHNASNNLERRFEQMMNTPKRNNPWFPLAFILMVSLSLSNVTIFAESTRPREPKFYEDKTEAMAPITEHNSSNVKVTVITKEEDSKITEIVHGKGNMEHVPDLKSILEERFTPSISRATMTWNFALSANQSKKSSGIYMGQNDVITLRLKWTPGTNGEVKVGIVDEYGSLSYHMISDWSVEIQFTVSQAGEYRIYVENPNSFKIDISSDVIY